MIAEDTNEGAAADAAPSPDEPLLDAAIAAVRLMLGAVALARAEFARMVRAVVLAVVCGLFSLLLTLSALSEAAAALTAWIVSLGVAPVLAHLCSAGLFVLMAAICVALIAWRLRRRPLFPMATLSGLRTDLRAVSDALSESSQR